MGSKNTKRINLSCLCRGFSASYDLPESEFPLGGCVCSCTSCRHASGQLYATFAVIPVKERPTGPTVSKYKFSPGLTVYFCNTCGATICNDTEALWECGTGIISVPHPGAVGDQRRGGKGRGIEGLVDRQCLFVSDTNDGGALVWLPKNNSAGREMKRHVGHVFGDEADVNSIVRAFNTHSKSVQAGERLYASCHCQSVRFFITRPDPKNPPAGDPKADGKKWWLAEPENPACQKYLARLDACDTCRLSTGFEVMAWAPIPSVNVFTETGGGRPRPFELNDPVHNLVHFESSYKVGRSFCKTCGAAVAYWNKAREVPVIGYGVGLFKGEGVRCEEFFSWKRGVEHKQDALDPSFIKELDAKVGS